jgi:mRNA interferase RelE/StbE
MPQVLMTPEAFDQFEGLPRTIKERIRKLVTRLEGWPAVSGVKALSGDLAGWYRLRTGDYRIRFRIDNGKISIDKIGHRKDVYDD